MNGILIVNKPSNCTSRDVVNIISKELNTKKVGHTGTLDPIATGVLVLAIGSSLKIAELITSEKKEYIARVILGYETDMLDITGKETKRNKPIVSKNHLIGVLNSFFGKIKQEVPLYSAVKVNGKKLYEYARNNLPVTPPVKEVEVYSIELISDIDYYEDTTEFTIKCLVSKGTYIRALIRDIAYKLNTYGTMKSLERTKQGIFDIENSYKIEDIKKGNYKILSIKEALPNIKIITLDDNMLYKVKNGQILSKFFDGELALLVDKNGRDIAIYKNGDNNFAKPYKMIEVQL